MSTAASTTATVKEESPFFVIRTFEKIKDACKDRISDYNEKYLKKYVDSGKEWKERIEKDVKKYVDDAREKGKNMVPEFKIVADLKEKTGKQLEKMRGKINLPTRTDLDRLTDIMDTLNTRVDKLSEKYSA